jgi:hypothetical protein
VPAEQRPNIHALRLLAGEEAFERLGQKRGEPVADDLDDQPLR